jgi:hypothetical protein
MSLTGLPLIRVPLGSFTPQQQAELQQLLLAIKANDDALAIEVANPATPSGFTPSQAIVSNAGGVLVVNATTATEIGFVHGVTSGIQAQFAAVPGLIAVETTRAEAAEALLAPLASPALTGNPTAPTQAPLDNSTKVATTAYTDAAVSAGGTGANPTFTTVSITGAAPGTPVLQRLYKEGIVKVWAYCTVSGGVVTVQETQNLSSVTYTSAGTYSLNFATALSSALYAVVFGLRVTGALDQISEVPGGTRSTTRTDIQVTNGVSSVDPPGFSVVIFGK